LFGEAVFFGCDVWERGFWEGDVDHAMLRWTVFRIELAGKELFAEDDIGRFMVRCVISMIL